MEHVCFVYFATQTTLDPGFSCIQAHYQSHPRPPHIQCPVFPAPLRARTRLTLTAYNPYNLYFTIYISTFCYHAHRRPAATLKLLKEQSYTCLTT